MRRPSSKLSFLLFLLLTAIGFAQTSPDFQNLAASATAAREPKRTEEAIQDYRRALDVRRDWEEGWWYVGTLEYDANHFAEAIPALRKVVELDPALGPAWYFLGLCEFETGDYPNSKFHLQKGAELGAGDDRELAGVSQYHLALLLIHESDFEKAWKILSSSMVDSGSQQVKAALGLTLLRVPFLPQQIDSSREGLIQPAGEAASLLAHGNSAKAISSLQLMLKEFQDTPYLHYAYGKALASGGHYEEALAQQREELKLSPQSAVVYVELSNLALRLHHGPEALAYASSAVRSAPESSAAYAALAQSEKSVGQAEKASKDLQTAESLGPEKPQSDARLEKFYAMKAAATQTQKSNGSRPAADFDKLAQQATSHQATGESADAIRLYAEGLKLRPDWDDGWWNLAMLNYQAGHYADTINALTTFVHRQPSNGTAWAVMGLSEFESKQYGSALIHLRRGQELGFGGSAESVQLATYRLGILLNRDSQFERAMEILAPQAQAQSLRKEVEFALGMSLLRIPVLPEQVELAKRPLVQSAGQVAVLLENSKYADALPRLRTMLQQYPAVPFLHYAYGVALVSLSQYEDASEQFQKEEAISPKSELPHLRLASIALRTFRPLDAEQFAGRAVQLAPESGEAHYLLGRAYLSEGKQIAAIGELETAAKISPASPEVHFNLAKAYGKANLPEKEESERATFSRLNELAQQQRGKRGSQSYGASRDTSDFHTTSTEPASEQSQPQ